MTTKNFEDRVKILGSIQLDPTLQEVKDIADAVYIVLGRLISIDSELESFRTGIERIESAISVQKPGKQEIPEKQEKSEKLDLRKIFWFSGKK